MLDFGELFFGNPIWIALTNVYEAIDAAVGDLGGTIIKSAILAVILGGYLVPTFIAHSKKKPNLRTVALVNVFAGFTVIGWFVALGLSLKKVK
jgi:hypothetical protein